MPVTPNHAVPTPGDMFRGHEFSPAATALMGTLGSVCWALPGPPWQASQRLGPISGRSGAVRAGSGRLAFGRVAGRGLIVTIPDDNESPALRFGCLLPMAGVSTFVLALRFNLVLRACPVRSMLAIGNR